MALTGRLVSEEPRKKDQELAAKDAAAVGLKRARPVRKLFYKRGHKFEPKQFYQIMRCATCGEFLLTTAYQCVQCKYTCHKACHERVLAKCITKSEGEKDEDEGAAAAAIMKHNIPHRFEKASTMTPQWCSHCGYMMPFGLPRKQIMRCSECPVLCHEGCMPLIPNLCGMSTEVAQNMMEAIEQAERRKQERTRTSQQGYAGSVEVRAERLSLDGQPAVSPEEDLARSQRTAGVSGPVTVPAPTLPGPPPSISISETPMAPPVSAPARVSSLSPTTRASAPQAPVISVSPVSVDKPQYGYPSPPAVRPPEGVVGTVSNATSVVSEASTSAVAVAPAPREPTKKRSKPSVGLDDFHFLAVLGKGNFGKVMLAEEKLTGNLYAIKVLKKDFIIKNDEVESVKSEKRVFQTANVARHPFLVNLHSCFQTETRVYFVMEYVSGGDLMWHIQHHQFSEKRAKFYACEVLLAIEYFHQNNIVYRWV